MSDSDRYFAANEATQGTGAGTFVAWADLTPIQIGPGLKFMPVLGENVMVSFVRYEPDTEAPLHWHEEEQIAFVLEGELEFEVAGEVRILRPGEAVVIPANVPHGARTREGPCLQVDVFQPPRRGLLEAMGRVPPD